MNSREVLRQDLVATAITLARETLDRSSEIDSKGDLRSQVLRASVSVALNLAEGIGKNDVFNFFGIARGSLFETVAGMQIAGALGLAEKYHQLGAAIDFELSKRSEPSKAIETSELRVVTASSFEGT